MVPALRTEPALPRTARSARGRVGIGGLLDGGADAGDASMTALCLMPPVVQPIPPKPELRLIPVFYQRQSRFDVREETPAERPRTVAVEVGGLKIRVELCGDGQR